jgi:hypothetical protein
MTWLVRVALQRPYTFVVMSILEIEHIELRSYSRVAVILVSRKRFETCSKAPKTNSERIVVLLRLSRSPVALFVA